MKIDNHYEWDQHIVAPSSKMFEEVVSTLERGGYNPEALTSAYLVMYTLNEEQIERPWRYDNFNQLFLRINSLVQTLKSVWLWLCFNWRYHRKPIPMIGTQNRMLHEVWIDMVRRQCFPPYRKKRCKRVPLFFHNEDKSCSFCNANGVIPDRYHCIELLYLHAWSAVSAVDWERLIMMAMTQPFTIHHLPHIALHRQFDVFKLLIEDHYNSLDE